MRDTYPKIKEEFVDTGKIRYALLDLPLESIHKKAFKAAEATLCAQDQGKYWEMHERLFANQKALEPWSDHAAGIGLDVGKFEQCMTDGKNAKAVRTDMKEAAKAGITGTPQFVLAVTDPKDPSKAKGLVHIRGAQPFERFKADIEEALTQQ